MPISPLYEGSPVRILGALLLALLGIGLFPLNARTLFTAPGVLFAVMGVALLFFAYRLVTHKKKEEEASDKFRKAEANVSETTKLGHETDSQFAVTPAMPDITKSVPTSGFMVGRRMVMFFREPQPIAKLQSGVDLPLRYLFAASVFNGDSRKMERLFTLETGFTNDIFLCAFERNGSHRNLGDGALLSNLKTFEAAIVSLVGAEHGVASESARPIAI